MLTIRATIHVAGNTVPQIIPVVQGDTARAILFTIADFTIPNGATANYYIQKPSGLAVYNAGTIDGNTVLVELTAQSIIEPGDNYLQVRILKDDDIVTSFDCILLVKPFRGIDATQSTGEMTIFDQAERAAAAQFQEDAESIAAEVIESIPADYTALSNQVSDLSADLISIADDDTTTAYLRMVFQRGRLDVSDGQIKSAAYRVSTTDIQQFDYDIVFSVSADYRMFFCLYNADDSYSSKYTGFITDDYTIKAGQKFRATVALRTGESSSVIADIPIFASNLFMTTKAYDEIEDIKADLYSPLKCGLLESKGTTINVADCTVTGTNVEVIDSCKSRFAQKSKLIRIKKLANTSSYEVNIQLPKMIPTDRFFLTFRMSGISKDTSVGSYFNVRYNSATNNLTHNNGLSTIQNWNNLIVHFSSSQNVTNVKLIFEIRNSVAVGDYCGEYWLDSLTFNSVMKPTFVLNFDQWWQESIDNGGYQYCFDNNIPFTLMTKNYDSLGSTFVNLAKQAEQDYGCENSYYASYGSSNTSLLNASTYNSAVGEVAAMKNDFVNAFGHDFISFGCTQMKLNSIDRTALRNANIKMIRGDGAQLIPYYDDEEYWTPCIGISSDTLTLAQVKTQIDYAVQFGYCMLAYTHGICADNSNVMSGSSSNGMHVTDFKAMIDYLVSLRSQGKIQICTMEDWYNQCVQ